MTQNNTKVLTVKEAAKVLKISLATAYQGVKEGDIPSIRIGKKIIVPTIALEQKLAEAGGDK